MSLIAQNMCNRVETRIQVSRVLFCYTPDFQGLHKSEVMQKICRKEWLGLHCWEAENLPVIGNQD